MKKKGFTLIELLAVIVILAVIALIATPAVLNIIEDSKKSAAEASARNIASAAKAYYMSNLMNDISTGDIDLSNGSFKYDGEQATKGYITYDAKGNVTGKMYVSGYCIEITESNTTSEKVDESKCDITSVFGKKTFSGTVTMTDPDGIHYILYDGKDSTGKELCQVTRESATCNIKVSSGYMYAGVKSIYSLTVTSSKGVKVTNVDYHTLLIEVLENNFELNIDQLQYFPNQ